VVFAARGVVTTMMRRRLSVFVTACLGTILALFVFAFAGCSEELNPNPGRITSNDGGGGSDSTTTPPSQAPDSSTPASSRDAQSEEPAAIIILPPTNVVAVAGDQSATVNWTPSPATANPLDYTITSTPAGFTHTTAMTQAVVTGLTNGTSYTFTVVVRTAKGTSAPSNASNPVTPAGLPAAPTNIVAAPGNTTAALTWTAPSANGSPITGYSVTATPGGATQTATNTALTFTGLTNGTSYTFKVRATNAVGMGAESAASNAVTPMAPANVPDPPANVVAVAGNGSASVTWTAPNDNGSAITGYTILSNPGGLTGTAGAGVTTGTVNGLTNGTSYTFTVTATNANGTSAPSSASAAVTPTGPPGAPTAVTATAGDTTATVMWTAPANNGGSAITGYTVTSNPGGLTGTAGAGATSATVNGLTNGTTYTFTVTATNALGTGTASAASNAVTPAGVPSAPTNVLGTIANTNSLVSWTAASANGSPITSYTVTSNPGGFTATTAGGTSAFVVGLANGTAYTFTVTATNAAGTGPASAASAAVTPNACAQTLYNVTNSGAAYVIEGFAGTNPQIILCLGTTYTFHVATPGHPFGLYAAGGMAPRGDATNNNTQNGDVVWTVPAAEPAGAFYQCGIHNFMTNTFVLQ
jgi:hypothetical protein